MSRTHHCHHRLCSHSYYLLHPHVFRAASTSVETKITSLIANITSLSATLTITFSSTFPYVPLIWKWRMLYNKLKGEYYLWKNKVHLVFLLNSRYTIVSGEINSKQLKIFGIEIYTKKTSIPLILVSLAALVFCIMQSTILLFPHSHTFFCSYNLIKKT